MSYPMRMTTIGNTVYIAFEPDQPLSNIFRARFQVSGMDATREIRSQPKSRKKLGILTRFIGLATQDDSDDSTTWLISSNAITTKPSRKRILLPTPWQMNTEDVATLGSRGVWVSPDFHSHVQHCEAKKPCVINIGVEKGADSWMLNFFRNAFGVSDEETQQYGRLAPRIVIEFPMK
jgi:hypothetical protein